MDIKTIYPFLKTKPYLSAEEKMLLEVYNQIFKVIDASSQIGGATKDFVRQYKKMRKENIIGNDSYNHAVANSKATLRGPYGKKTAQVLSFAREATDVLRKGDTQKDVREDNVANRYGRNIQPGQNPEDYNAIFDTRRGGSRVDLTNIAPEITPKNPNEFLNTYFTRDAYEK